MNVIKISSLSDTAVGVVMMALVVAELVTGFLALRHITRHQANKFHLQQFISSSEAVEGFINQGYQEEESAKKII